MRATRTKTRKPFSRPVEDRRSLASRAVAYAILLVACGAIVATFAPSLDDPGYLIAWDAEGHLLRAQHYMHRLLPEGHLAGWFPAWNGGYDVSQSYAPLFHYLLGGLLLPLRDETALRLATGLLWVGLVPAHYYLLRSFDLERPIAALGAALVPGLSESWGIGPSALYGVGLLANGLGCILAIVVLGRLKRDLSRPERGPRAALVTGLGLGLLILAHTFSVYWWGLASLVLVLTEVAGRGKPAVVAAAKRYGTVLGVGLVVSAWWWIPMLLGRAQTPLGRGGDGDGPPRDYARGEVLDSLLLARGSGGYAITALALAGVAYLAASRRWRSLAFFLGIATLSLLLALHLVNFAFPFSDVIQSQYSRFNPFTAWLVVALAGFGMGGAYVLLRRLPAPAAQVCIAVAALLLWLEVVGPKLDEHSGFIHVNNGAAARELPALERGLERALGPGDFILPEFSWDARPLLGTPHLVTQRLPSVNRQAWMLSGNFLEGTEGGVHAYRVAGALGDPARLKPELKYLRERGVRFLIAALPKTRATLLRQEWLEPVAGTGPALQAFELKGARPFGLPPAAGAQLAEAPYEASSQAYRLRFRRPVSLPSGTHLALSYHPWLRVKADGRELRTYEDDEHRLRLAESAFEVEALEIAYRRSGLAVAANLFSALGLAGVAIVLYRRRRG